eukprot:COSAG05_NODE_1123_length_5793_cov_4.158588_7_plen_67_part_00
MWSVEENVVISLLYALATKGQPLLHDDASAVLLRLVDVLGLSELATLYPQLRSLFTPLSYFYPRCP